MLRLVSLIYTILGPTIAGTALIAVVIQPNYDGWMVTVAAIGGGILAIPLSWFVAYKLHHMYDKKA